MSGWKPGDRVRVQLPDHQGVLGRRGKAVWISGTVRQVDPPGSRPGVLVDLDQSLNGVNTCYATHRELVAL